MEEETSKNNGDEVKTLNENCKGRKEILVVKTSAVFPEINGVFIQSCIYNHRGNLRKCIKDDKFDVNRSVALGGFSPLHVATLANNAFAVGLLLTKRGNKGEGNLSKFT